MLIPGEQANVRLTLFKQMVMNIGQAFSIREGHYTVTTGIITKIRPAVVVRGNKLSNVVVDTTS